MSLHAIHFVLYMLPLNLIIFHSSRFKEEPERALLRLLVCVHFHVFSITAQQFSLFCFFFIKQNCIRRKTDVPISVYSLSSFCCFAFVRISLDRIMCFCVAIMLLWVLFICVYVIYVMKVHFMYASRGCVWCVFCHEMWFKMFYMGCLKILKMDVRQWRWWWMKLLREWQAMAVENFRKFKHFFFVHFHHCTHLEALRF